MTADASPPVSVVVPVYNDRKQLMRCLEALSEQVYPADRYEVIVVDNGSDQPVQPLIQEFDCAVLGRESRPGSYAARNRGVAMATGTILAFTDADCIPQPRWIEAGVECLTAAENCGLVGGRVELFFQDPQDLSPTEKHQKLTAFSQQDYIRDGHYSVTANLFTHRSVVDEVGPFDASLKSSGDMEWGQRVYQAGYDQRYCPEAVVKHPARQTLREVCRKEARVFGGQYELQARERGLLYNLARALWMARPPISFLRKLFSDPRFESPVDQAEVTAVELARRFVWVKEQLRLTFGGEPRR